MNESFANISPPSAARIASEQGGTLKELYDTVGLICYRKLVTLEGGAELIEEGWLEHKEMPNGTILQLEKRHKLLSLEDAENE